MFGGFFRGGSSSPKGSSEARKVAQYFTNIISEDSTSGDRRDAAFSLREVMQANMTMLAETYTSEFKRRLAELSTILLVEENEEVAQILLEVLSLACEFASDTLLEDTSGLDLLLRITRESRALWVRIAAVQVMESLSNISPDRTVEQLLAIPSALELLVDLLNDEERDVRNEMLVLLMRLTDVSEQVRMFMTFCDAPGSLLRIAKEERQTLVAPDCVTLCANCLRDNPIGQKQFLELKESLETIVDFLVVDQSPPDHTAETLRIAKSIELIRVLCEWGQSDDTRYCPSVPRVNSSTADDRRKPLEASKIIGAMPHVIENILAVAKDQSGIVEEHTKREASIVLGDLICRNTRNGNKLERIAGYSFLALSALTSSRWVDANSTAYAWYTSLVGIEGEQRALALLGHALAPPPGSYDDPDLYDGDDEKQDNPVSLIVETLINALESCISLRDELFVEPSRVLERRISIWRALQLWESLLVSPASKELALRVVFKDRLLLDHLCESVPVLLQEKDDTDAVKQLTADTFGFVLRTLTQWVDECVPAAEQFLSKASNMFFFDPLGVDPRRRLLGALFLACLLNTLREREESKQTVLGLLEKHMGVSLFVQILGSLETQGSEEAGISTEEIFWSEDACTERVFDDRFYQRCKTLVSRANVLLMRGASTAALSSPEKSKSPHVQGATSASESEPTANGIDFRGVTDVELAQRYRKLERDYADLLLVLAHQEVERQSLLQTIEKLGGKAALSEALKLSAVLLSKAFDEPKKQ